jgi:hypothetical protein
MKDSTHKTNTHASKLRRNKEGKLHCLDGPAVEYSDGSKEWWINGKLHRLNGPAAVWLDGHNEWYICGDESSEEEFSKHPLAVFYRLSRDSYG